MTKNTLIIITLIIKRTDKFFLLCLLQKPHVSWHDFARGLETDISRIKMYESVLFHYPDKSPASEPYKEELQYIKQHRSFSVFPYDALGTIPEPEIGFDESCHLHFLLHNNKRLFFPESWNQRQIIDYYTNTLSIENILETEDKYLRKTPHRYQSAGHKIEEGDILVDAGSAEGLFTLDNIEHVSKAIIIECDKKWENPLKETFKPYMDKVSLVFKMLGEKDSEDTISLSTILQGTNPSPTFIKMDIEGAEANTIESSISFFKCSDRILKISCCTYHNNDDFARIFNVFKQLNCKTECSDGYMLIYDYAEKQPYFRHGLIRATITPQR